MEKNELVLIHGTNYGQMTQRLCEAIRLAELIGTPDRRIMVKPNLVVSAAADKGAVTHPQIVDGVLRYLAQNGFKHVKVAEGSWVGALTGDAFAASGIAQVCRQNGVEYIDLQRDSVYEVDACGMRLKLCAEVANTDFLINLPVLKGHCQTAMTCALKNCKGLLPNSEKRRFHQLGLHRPIAHLNTVIPPEVILVDNICGDLDFEEGGNPVVMNRIFAARDPVLCDTFAAHSMGYTPDDIPYIRMAEALGVGTAELSRAKLTQLNRPVVSAAAHPSGRVRHLADCADAREACSACYGSLIYALDRLDKQGEAFAGREKICIGHGWQGRTGGIGVGSCTAACRCSLKGCPPTAGEMVGFLKDNWRK